MVIGSSKSMDIDDYSRKLYAAWNDAGRPGAPPGKVGKLDVQFKASVGWDKLCDKAKLGTHDALYRQLETHAGKNDAPLLMRELTVSSETVVARNKKRVAAEEADEASLQLTKQLAKQRASNKRQKEEIRRLETEVASLTQKAQQTQAELSRWLSAETKLGKQEPTESVQFQVAHDLFTISAAAIDKKGGLFKMMLSDAFAAPQNDSGVVQIDWPNLLAADFSLLVAWYEDKLPSYVSMERYERLLPYLDYLDLTDCARDVEKIVVKPWSAAQVLADKVQALELQQADHKNAFDALKKKWANYVPYNPADY